MTILTRTALCDGSFAARLGHSDANWTRDDIDRSLAGILRTRPPGPVWVFGYGSLMWNPLLEFDCRMPATLDGWHRSFCLRTIAGRGSPSAPGRMLSLEPGGRTQGLALRLHDEAVEAELKVLWAREMVTGGYCPRWCPITLSDGESAQAIAFLADPARPRHECDASIPTIAPIIARAVGSFGSNADYVHRLDDALKECGLRDDYIESLVAELNAIQAPVEAPSRFA